MSRKRWSILIAVSLPVPAFAACNSILGNDKVSLLDAGTVDATTGSDAHRGVDATADTGSASKRDGGADSGHPSGKDSGRDAAEAGCTPGAQRCSGDDIQTCGASGSWAGHWECASHVCNDAGCAPTGAGADAASCQALGDAGCGKPADNCCASPEVPGGAFDRVYDLDAGDAAVGDGSPTGLGAPARVSGFRLDKYEVTVGRFRQFVNAVLPDGGTGGVDGGLAWVPAPGSGKHVHLNGGLGLVNGSDPTKHETGWPAGLDSEIAPTTVHLMCGNGATWTAAAGANESAPINCMNWAEAQAFCIWDGGFLPSDAEWEYAAAGGGQQREYPWGGAYPGAANQYAIYNNYYPANGPPGVDTVGALASGAGAWGQLDLAGNVEEYNLDWYLDGGVLPAPCTDCAALSASTSRGPRGGNYASATAAELVPSSRVASGLETRSVMLGFRCARVP